MTRYSIQERLFSVVPDGEVPRGLTQRKAGYKKGYIFHMKTPDELSKEKATANLMASFSSRRSRRSLLKGAVAGAAGVAAVGAGSLLLPKYAHASGGGEGPEDTIVQILSIAATAEQLAVT